MSYIQNNLQAGEEIKYKADIHWYIFAYPVILLLLSAFFSSAQTGLFYYVSIFLLLSGLFQLIKRILLKMGAEYVVTNKKVILKSGILNKIKMSAPQFYNIGKGKRIEVKVCNEDSIQIRRVRCLLYYSNSGKKECIGKIWISPLIGYETCYFCMNVDIPLTKDEWHKLTFRIKRGKNYKDYKFLKQQVQE